MPPKRKYKPCGKCSHCLVTDTCGKCTHCTQPHLKKRCKARTCKVQFEVVVVVEEEDGGVVEGLWMENQQPNKPSENRGQVETEVKQEDFGFARPLGGFLV